MDQVQAVERPGIVGRIVGGIRGVRQFLLDVRAEMKKVTWPTRQELIDATRRVIIMTLLIGVVIGVLDRVLQWILVDGVAALSR
jgi:preprotein translocase subunit SecE